MYLQIVRAWLMTGGWSMLRRRIQKRILLLSFSIFLLAFIFLNIDHIFAYSTAGDITGVNNLPVLTIKEFHRILIISPHPDDETLAAGGVMQEALAEGSQVKVVVVTNGDAQKFAPMVIGDKLDPQPADYVAMGKRRQAEVKAALHKLGLRSEDITFLGYPDRGTSPMWMADWRTQCPYTAFYTRVEENPYPDTYHPGDVYCGNHLLNDLQSIIDGYRPDLIVLPHPADQHPDHGAVSNFARLAIAVTNVQDKKYMPQVWGYIVHYGMFPEPRGKYLNHVLMPPRRLSESNNHWGSFNLSSSQVAVKYAAIEEYPSQNLLLGKFLPSFARRNELFEALPMQILPPIAFTNLPVFMHGVTKSAVTDLLEANNEEFPVRGNLLTGWQTARLKNKLWLNLQMKRDILPDLDCNLYLKLPDGRTNKLDLTPIGSVISSRVFVAQVDLAALGNPSVVAFAVELKQGGILVSKTGWHILDLQ